MRKALTTCLTQENHKGFMLLTAGMNAGLPASGLAARPEHLGLWVQEEL